MKRILFLIITLVALTGNVNAQILDLPSELQNSPIEKWNAIKYHSLLIQLDPQPVIGLSASPFVRATFVGVYRDALTDSVYHAPAGSFQRERSGVDAYLIWTARIDTTVAELTVGDVIKGIALEIEARRLGIPQNEWTFKKITKDSIQ
jgi:hypothetical protein